MSSEAGTRIRRALADDARAIANVRVEGWRTAYRGLIPDAYLDGMRVEASEALWQRVLGAAPNRTCVFVAEHDGDVVGFGAGNMLDPPKLGCDAELTAIYLLSSHRRTGIGRRLVSAVAATQRSFGATSLLTWVIAGNRPARAFYEALGAELLVEQPFQWDGMDLLEAGYAIRDIDRLIADGGAAAVLH